MLILTYVNYLIADLPELLRIDVPSTLPDYE